MLKVDDILLITSTKSILTVSDKYYKFFKIPFVGKRCLDSHVNITAFKVKGTFNVCEGVSVVHINSMVYNLDLVILDDSRFYSVYKENGSNTGASTSTSTLGLPPGPKIPTYSIDDFVKEFELEY